MLSTIRLPADEDVNLTPEKPVRDVLQSVSTPAGLQFSVCTALPAGSTLLIADDVFVYASLLGEECAKMPARHLFLPPNHAAGSYAQSVTSALSAPETKHLRKSYEWFLVLRILQRSIPDKTVSAETAADALRTALFSFPRPGEETYVQNVRSKRMKLIDTDREWLGALVRLYPMLPMKQLLDTYELVLAHMHRMYSPISNVLYGLTMSPLLARIPHSCVPSGRVVWCKDGIARVVATRPLEQGEYLTVNRHIHALHSVRCLQIAPMWVRRMALCSSGRSCDCSECLAVVGELQLKYGLDTTGAVNADLIAEYTARLWSMPEQHDLSDIDERLRPVLEQPYLVRRHDPLQFVQKCKAFIDKLYIEKDFMAKQSPHVVSDVTSMVLQAITLNPVDTERLFTAELLAAVVQYERTLGLETVKRLLKVQEASVKLVEERCLAHMERCSLNAVHALHLPVLVRMIDEYVAKESGRTMASILEQLKERPELKEMRSALENATIWCTMRMHCIEAGNEQNKNVAYCASIRCIQSESFLSHPLAALAAS